MESTYESWSLEKIFGVNKGEANAGCKRVCFSESPSFVDSTTMYPEEECHLHPDMASHPFEAWLGPQLWNRCITIESYGSSLDQALQQQQQQQHHPDHMVSSSSEADFDVGMIQPGLHAKPSRSVKDGDEDQGDAVMDEDDEELLDAAYTMSDIALASTPGTHFNPRSRSFSNDELKPQPIVRKRRKTYVADKDKNSDYWARRVKNNIAARRSREARRLKENQIALRTAFLEKENLSLKDQINMLKEVNCQMEKTNKDLLAKMQRLLQLNDK